MTIEIDFRTAEPGDLDAVLRIYPLAFPDEDLVPLVKQLADCPDVYSLIAAKAERVVGHVAFTMCTLENDDRRFALLGPLAVDPKHVRQGIGSQLVHVGIEELHRRIVAAIFVLGDPAYYSRFGFSPEQSVQPPFPLHEEWAGAWQAVWSADRHLCKSAKLVVPSPWRNKSLWS